MKRKTAALYDPYLDVLGGGERHILSVLQVLEQEDYDITVFWNSNLSDAIRDRLNIRFKRLAFQPNIFSFPSPFKKLQNLATFDMFFYVTDGSYFFSSAKKNFVFSMVPDKNLYRMNLTNKLKTSNYRFIANSSFTAHWLNRLGIRTDVIYPYISEDFIETVTPNTEKEKIILAVGRFFPHLHAKNHAALLNAFGRFHERHPDFRMVLAGGLKKEDADYFKDLEEEADKQPDVMLKPNIPYKELLDLYKKSLFFWHFTGFGVNEEDHPERVEHLGMTPLEAMATGTIPFCYQAGGPKEIITDGKNGYLFRTPEELIGKTESLLGDPVQYKKMQQAARKTVHDKFSYDTFRNNVMNIVLRRS